jgi:hypothetical protein
MVQLASTRAQGLPLAMAVSFGILCSLYMTTPSVALVLHERNTADLFNADEAFPMSDIANAWEEAQLEASTGEFHHHGHGHRLIKKSSTAHRDRVEKRKVVEQDKRSLNSKSINTQDQGAATKFELPVTERKRQWLTSTDRGTMWMKNIALTAGTAIFEGGCWLATRLFRLNSWQEASCMTGVALASLATAFATNTRPPGGGNAGWIRAAAEQINGVREIWEDVSGPTRRSAVTSREEIASMFFTGINDTSLLESAQGPSGLLDPRTGAPLSHATWLTAAIQPLLVANDISNVTSLLWLDIYDEQHINVNTWLPVLGEPIDPDSGNNTTDLDKRMCIDKTSPCPSRGCIPRTWRTCGSGTVAGPNGHYFHQDVYGGEAAYWGLAYTFGAAGNEGLRRAAQSLSDKKMSQQAWHTCVCFELDGEWVSTGSSQFTWDGGSYLGHDQCYSGGCGSW